MVINISDELNNFYYNIDIKEMKRFKMMTKLDKIIKEEIPDFDEKDLIPQNIIDKLDCEAKKYVW